MFGEKYSTLMSHVDTLYKCLQFIVQYYTFEISGNEWKDKCGVKVMWSCKDCHDDADIFSLRFNQRNTLLIGRRQEYSITIGLILLKITCVLVNLPYYITQFIIFI